MATANNIKHKFKILIVQEKKDGVRMSIATLHVMLWVKTMREINHMLFYVVWFIKEGIMQLIPLYSAALSLSNR